MLTCPVVINNPLNPGASFHCFGHLRHDDRVLFRNHGLIVETVLNPGLKLSSSEFTLVHQDVERVFVMIPFRSDCTEPFSKFLTTPQGLASGIVHAASCSLVKVYTSIVIPSNATSHPASSTTRRSGESSI